MISIAPIMGEIGTRAMGNFGVRAPATMMTDLGARLADDDHLRIDLRRILTTAMRVMAGLIAESRRKPGQSLIFVHTGGGPAIFAYANDLRRDVVGKPV